MSERYELVTLLDAGFLARGIVLHRSLAETGAPFRLRVLCMDEASRMALDALALPGLETIALEDVEAEDPAVLREKPSRTLTEYCWLLKPALVLGAFAGEPELGHLAYVDADQMFWADPAPVFDGYADATTLVVPQRIESTDAGRFNAGFIVFRRAESTLELLRWWRERCLEWSFDREEGGNRTFGDQGYLSEWPERFAGVQAIEHPGVGLAPWNSAGSVIGERDGRVLVDGEPLLLYHYHSLRVYEGLHGVARTGLLPPRFGRNAAPVPFVWSLGRWYSPSAAERSLLWKPYARRLSEAIALVRSVDPGYDQPRVHVPARELANEVVRRAAVRTARRALGSARRLVNGARPAHG